MKTACRSFHGASSHRLPKPLPNPLKESQEPREAAVYPLKIMSTVWVSASRGITVASQTTDGALSHQEIHGTPASLMSDSSPQKESTLSPPTTTTNVHVQEPTSWASSISSATSCLSETDSAWSWNVECGQALLAFALLSKHVWGRRASVTFCGGFRKRKDHMQVEKGEVFVIKRNNQFIQGAESSDQLAKMLNSLFRTRSWSRFL